MVDVNMIMRMLPLIENNPVGIAQQSGFNIPQNQQFKGPEDMVKYLMNTGQIDQNIFNQARAQAQMMGYKI